MKAGAVPVLLLLLSSQAHAQSSELTLDCRYNSYLDGKKDREQKMSGGFSAIVKMQNEKGGTSSATVQATTTWCFDFEGTFNDLQVHGECERTIGSAEKVTATITINRITGEFDNTIIRGKSYEVFTGQCTPAKKIF